MELTAEWVSAIATSVATVATIVLVIVAVVQLGGLKKQLAMTTDAERRRYTLEACQRFEKDPSIRQAMQHIWSRTKAGTDYTLLDDTDKFHALTLLNYFDGVACGIEQSVIIEEMAKDYLHYCIEKSVKALLKGQSGADWSADKPLVEIEGFESLLWLFDRWFPPKNTGYKMPTAP